MKNLISLAAENGVKRYFRTSTKSSSHKAHARCQAEKATLARPQSGKEFDALRNFNVTKNIRYWIGMKKKTRFITHIRSHLICSSPYTDAEKWAHLAWQDGNSTVTFPHGIRFWSTNCGEECYYLKKHTNSLIYIDNSKCSLKSRVLCEGSKFDVEGCCVQFNW